LAAEWPLLAQTLGLGYRDQTDPDSTASRRLSSSLTIKA
jgi:hypothetical protein